MGLPSTDTYHVEPKGEQATTLSSISIVELTPKSDARTSARAHHLVQRVLLSVVAGEVLGKLMTSLWPISVEVV